MDILDILVTQEMSSLDEDLRPVWVEGYMSCSAEKVPDILD